MVFFYLQIMNNLIPEKIICITEETTETIYLLGEEKRLIGISGFTKRPKIAKKQKEVVSTFLDADIEKIIELEPDLVIGFSDIQSSIAEKLIKKGVTVLINNYRSINGIFKMIYNVGCLVGKSEASKDLINEIKNKHKQIAKEVSKWKKKPKVYFEEWDNPQISGIKWVSEIIHLCGGNDIFIEHSNESLAKHRIISSCDVIKKNPDIIIASWCGKKVKKEKIKKRNGWEKIKAVNNNEIHEIKSEIILQPGPASVTDGAELIHEIFSNWYKRNIVS